jgi:uncharacterized membrane protein (DUF2068 family)
MRTHIQILAWIYLILGGWQVLVGVTFMVGAWVLAQAGAGPSAMGLTVHLGLAACLLLCLGLPLFFAGRGLLKRRRWGRILGIVVSVLHLPLGIYGLIVLLWPGAEREFS